MKEIDLFKSLFDAVVHCNSSEFIFNFKECGLPDFVNVDDFGQVNFYKDAKANLLLLVQRLHKKIDLTERSIDLQDFNGILRISIAECVALFFKNNCNLSEIIYEDYFELLKNKINNKLERKKINLAHHFLADSSPFVGDVSFKVGPVTLSGLCHWMRVNRFKNDEVNNLFLMEVNPFVKSNNDLNDVKPWDVNFVSKWKDAKTIVSVDISGRGGKISRRISLAIAQVALDAVSLLLGEKNGFFQNILKEDFSYNNDYFSIVSHDGFLFVAEYGLTKSFPILPSNKYLDLINANVDFITSLDCVLSNLIMDRNGKLSKISHRWVTALNWFAQGCREADDSIAIAKLATSLDILANSGNSSGTLNVISHVLKMDKDDIFDKNNKLTLERFFVDFYSEGRSKFVHGAFADRFERYELMRSKAFVMARLVLIKSLFLIKNYDGKDHDKGFKFL